MQLRVWMWGVVASAGLLACAGTQKPAQARVAEAPVTASAPEIGTFGLDVSGMDTSVKPGDAHYLAPEDRVRIW